MAGQRSRGRDGARTRQSRGDSLVGTEWEVEVGAVAHGGHCVARHEGRVLFVRHTLPGERVRVRVTEGDTGSSFLRADAVEVLEPSPDRVEPPCPYAGVCGGCDFQHATLDAQRRLKAAVVAEQLQRVAGLSWDVQVEEVPGAPDGLGWRTRVQYAVGRDGRAGLRQHRSRELVVLTEELGPCRIAHPDAPAVHERPWRRTTALETVVSATGETARVRHPVDRRERVRVEGPRRLTERVALPSGDHDFEVSTRSFWQVHPGAPVTLASVVAELAGVRQGETVLDLYAGAGLLSVELARAAGSTGWLVAVEGDGRAAASARRNLPTATVVAADVEKALGDGSVPPDADVVVLDPPRTGARRAVVEEVLARSPRAVVHVACDPGALARDVALYAEHGYRVEVLRAFDLFPMTQHVECVARLVPGS
ncbi:TRAM domain-containing protein [Nocardioidaceae bacterium]|nr:TRAM domain-containing protein [Nocardioidaceae bacterium]